MLFKLSLDSILGGFIKVRKQLINFVSQEEIAEKNRQESFADRELAFQDARAQLNSESCAYSRKVEKARKVVAQINEFLGD